MQRDKNAVRAVLLSASIMPVMFTVGQVVGQIYKHYNPNNVDINSGLAYLRHIMVSALLAGLLTLLFAVYFAAKGMLGKDQYLAKLSLRIAGLQFLPFVVVVVAQLIFPT